MKRDEIIESLRLTDRELAKALDEAPTVKEYEGNFWERIAYGHKIAAEAQLNKVLNSKYVKVEGE